MANILTLMVLSKRRLIKDVKAEQPVTYFVFVIKKVSYLRLVRFNQENHHDLFNIVAQFEDTLAQLASIGIRLDGLILKTDSGSACLKLRQLCDKYGIEVDIKLNSRNGKTTELNECVDPPFYQYHFVIERAFGKLENYILHIIVNYD